MSYRIARVDADDDEVASELKALHLLCFGDTAPSDCFDDPDTAWWCAYPLALVALMRGISKREPVAFAGIKPSQTTEAGGYLVRCGVLPAHQGRGLQKRLLRVRAAYAKRQGWKKIVTDTTDNVESSNSLIRCGYRLYRPAGPWGFQSTLYWQKGL